MQQQYWSQGGRGHPYPQSQPILAPNHPYPQNQTNFQQMPPGFVPPVLFITQQPHHFQDANPPRSTLSPVQLIPNPNNNPTQDINNIELQILPSYLISTVHVHEIQL